MSILPAVVPDSCELIELGFVSGSNIHRQMMSVRLKPDTTVLGQTPSRICTSESAPRPARVHRINSEG